jgi:hypothetical protein
MARKLRREVEDSYETIRDELVTNFLGFRERKGEDRSRNGWRSFMMEKLSIDLPVFNKESGVIDKLLGRDWRPHFIAATARQRRIVDREDGPVQEHLDSDPAHR